MVCVRYFVYC